MNLQFLQGLPRSLPSKEGTPRKVSSTFARKLRPESGRDCLFCAMIARQRKRVAHIRASVGCTRTSVGHTRASVGHSRTSARYALHSTCISIQFEREDFGLYIIMAYTYLRSKKMKLHLNAFREKCYHRGSLSCR